MRKLALSLLVAAIVAAALYWLLRPTPPELEMAVVGERKATVWSRLAQVREPVATLNYGDAVSVVERRAETPGRSAQVLVRTVHGLEGWMDARHLLAPEIYERAKKLLEESRAMSVQARGRTKVLTNMRLEVGRSAPRFFQLRGGQPVEIFARAVASAGSAAEEPAAKDAPGPEAARPAEGKKEDWLLVRVADDDAGEIAGWVRGSFIELELPEPLRAYAAGIRFVAWFSLSRVPESAGGSDEAEGATRRFRDQYLAAGTTEPEGRECDFTLLRIYTWNPYRRRYETAYVESRFCGRLPVEVKPIPPGADPMRAEATFSFTAVGRGGEQLKKYQMRHNIVRPLRGPR
jgi:hypothetical protein